jgi:hypothetical protein
VNKKYETMKKFYLSAGAAILLGPALFAQAYIGQVEKQKVSQAAAAIKLPFGEGAVADALKAYFSGKGFKPSDAHGWIIYRGVPLDSVDKDGSDLYFVMDMPDRKIKDLTVLSVVPAKKTQGIGNGSFVDSSRLDQARAFLDNLAPFVQNYGTGVQVNSREDALKKSQKKMNDLLSEQEDLNKRLRRLQTDLDQNKTDQIKAGADLQASINANDENKQKNQKRVSKLIDEQGSLEKKIRKTQAELDDNKIDQQRQQTAIAQQQQGLDAVKQKQDQ